MVQGYHSQTLLKSSIYNRARYTLGRPVHPSVVYRALPRPGWRKVIPRPRHPKANEEAREAFKKVTATRPGKDSQKSRSVEPRPAGARDVSGRGPLRANQ